jgi:hypothetical protein
VASWEREEMEDISDEENDEGDEDEDNDEGDRDLSFRFL